MKIKTLLAFSMAALLIAGTSFAGPNCPKNKDKSPDQKEGVYEVKSTKEGKCKSKCPKKDGEAKDDTYEVAKKKGDAKEADGEKRRGKKGDGKREGKRGKRGDRFVKMAKHLEMTEKQVEEAKAIMAPAREKVMELMKQARADKKAGKDVDRKEVYGKAREIMEGAMKKVYTDVLTDAQRKKVDEHKAKRAERRKEGKGKREGKRDGKKREGKGKKKDKGGDLDL